MATLVVDNFRGSMSIFQYGNINSGLSFIQPTGGINPYRKPGSLTWSPSATQIDSSYNVISDLVMCGKERVESGVLYVYAVGHTGRVYKIQVNNPSTNTADYDTPTLLTTITTGSPTFTRGGFIDFFGATERIYIGHDKGVTRIDFDGSNETAVSGTWTQTVPRTLKQFVGKLYIGNGPNIAEIDSTATVTSSAKLSPGFPTNTQVRDLDLSPDGIYLSIVVSRLALADVTSATQDTSTTANSESYIFKWNGTDTGYTSSDTFPSFAIGANILFQNYQYTFGSDQIGTAVFNPLEKIISLQEVQSILPNAVTSTGNIVTLLSPLYFEGVLEADLLYYGSFDNELGPGFWDVFFITASGTETDVVQTPFQLPISNFGLGSSTNGYTNNIFGTSKTYFSTLETSTNTTKYKFWKWIFPTSPNVPDNGTPIYQAVYQTQTQMFSKKVNVSEVRVYGEPWVANNDFTIDLIGSAGTPITGGSFSFNAGSNLTVGADFAWYNPTTAPTYAIGLRITNLGSANHVITKVEIDTAPAGK